MRKEDKELRRLLEMGCSQGVPPEYLEEFYRASRNQALLDAADYATRVGTKIFQEIAKGGPEAKGLATKVRDLFYGMAFTFRSGGLSPGELAQQVLAEAAKAPPLPKVKDFLNGLADDSAQDKGGNGTDLQGD